MKKVSHTGNFRHIIKRKKTMNRPFLRLILLFTCIILPVLTVTGCARALFGKPDGTFLGSCSGVMALDNGDRTRFTFSLYQVSDEDVNLYLNLPDENVWYATLNDFSIDNKVLRIELKDSGKVYTGKITGNKLKFKGEWGNYKGLLTIEMEE